MCAKLVNEMIDLLNNAFSIMNKNLSEPSYDNVSLEPAKEAEKHINAFRNKLGKEHLSRLSDPEYNVNSGIVYNTVVSLFERSGDHLINISEAIVGEI